MATTVVLPNVQPEVPATQTEVLQAQAIEVLKEADEEDDTEAEEWRIAFLEMKQENSRLLSELQTAHQMAMAAQEANLSRLTEQNLSLSNQLTDLTAKMMEQSAALTLIQSAQIPVKTEEQLAEENVALMPDKSAESAPEKDAVKTPRLVRRY